MLKKYYYPIAMYAIWRIIIVLFQLTLQPLIILKDKGETIYQRLFFSWVSYWDADRYMTVTKEGYDFPNQTFFPLPIVIVKGLTFTGLSPEIAAYLMETIFGLLTFVFFYILARKLTSEKDARASLLLFCCFPGTMFLNAYYSEAPVLALTLLSFILIEKKRYWLASICGAFATATRLSAIAISASFIFLKERLPKKSLYMLIAITGLLSYMTYLQINYGNPFYFAKAQADWCTEFSPCKLMFPLFTPIYYTIDYQRLYNSLWQPTDLFFTYLFLILLIPVYKILGKQYALYSFVVLSLWLTNGKIVSMTRYVIAAFPVFMIVPQLLPQKKYFIIICVVLLLLQLIYIAKFTNFLWVA